MRLIKGSLVMMIMIIATTLHAQFDPSKVCRVEEGKLIITLDKAWTRAQKLEVARLFDLDSTLVLNVYAGIKEITAGNVKWQVVQVGGGRVELSKMMGAAKTPTGTGNVIILDDSWMKAEWVNERESAEFGVNRFTVYNSFNYHGGIATFYLPRQLQARQVYLSGTFNNWGTMQTPMEKTDSGWVARLKLSPGKYLYKYIADGKWMHDPFNQLREDDWNGGFNSVVFCYNYRFSLKGYPEAKKVYLSGSFNGWNPSELSMLRVAGGWAIYLYLREGTHAYKFIVDGKWVPDPANPVVRKDEGGNENSFMSIGDTIYFRLKGNLDKTLVYLAGNFNGWNQWELKMQKTEGGWELPYVLAAGNYEYNFIVDRQWITDPDNPFRVINGGIVNSLRVVKPNYNFVLNDYPDAKKVIVTGNFSGWSTDNYNMVKLAGKWVFPIYLKPGKYTYKFIQDGNWLEDPANDEWETNQYGTVNSVLWIEP